MHDRRSEQAYAGRAEQDAPAGGSFRQNAGQPKRRQSHDENHQVDGD